MYHYHVQSGFECLDPENLPMKCFYVPVLSNIAKIRRKISWLQACMDFIRDA
jgi:hypothetical protein